MSDLVSQLLAASTAKKTTKKSAKKSAGRGASKTGAVKITGIETERGSEFMRAFFTYKGESYEVTKHPARHGWELYKQNSDGIFMFLGAALGHDIENIVPYSELEWVFSAIYAKKNAEVWKARDAREEAQKKATKEAERLFYENTGTHQRRDRKVSKFHGRDMAEGSLLKTAMKGKAHNVIEAKGKRWLVLDNMNTGLGPYGSLTVVPVTRLGPTGAPAQAIPYKEVTMIWPHLKAANDATAPKKKAAKKKAAKKTTAKKTTAKKTTAKKTTAKKKAAKKTTAKKTRTPAQKAATKRMLAANKARTKKAPRPR